jgi:MFS family permease
MSEDDTGRIPDEFEEAVGDRSGRRVIIMMGAILGLQAADTAAVGALAAPLERAFHVGNADIGLLVTVTTLVGCVATLPFGTLADRSSRTSLLQVAVALWAVATVVSALSVSFTMLLGARLALGVVIAAAGPALSSLFGDLVPVEHRSRLWGYVLMGELVGAGVGILVAGGLSGPFGWRVSLGILGLPAAVLAWLIRRELPEPERCGQQSLRVSVLHLGQVQSEPCGEDEEDIPAPSVLEQQAEAAGVEADPELVRRDVVDMSLWQAARYVLRIRTNVALIIASGLGYFFLAGLETFAELYFRERYGVSQGLATAMFLVVALGAVAGVLVSGFVTDRLIRNGRLSARILVGSAAYLGTTIAFVPGALSHILPLSMPIFFVAAFCIGAANPPVDAARLDIVPSRLWGRAEAVRTALRQVLQGLAPLFFGLVSEAFGGGGVGLSTGVDTNASVASASGAHGLEVAFVILSLPMLLGSAALWLSRSAYPREIVAARQTDESSARTARPWRLRRRPRESAAAPA